MSKLDMDEILSEVRANRARLKSCSKHEIAPNSYSFGKKVTCICCGGTMQATEYMAYVEGYKAAGGDPNDCWPGWEK